jgi:hypothetical protein
MSPGAGASRAVIVAATACFTFSSLAALASLLLGLATLSATNRPGADAEVVLVLLFLCALLCASGIFGVVAGINLLRLRNWARKVFVIWAGAIIILSVWGLYIGLVMLAVPEVPSIHSVFKLLIGLSLVSLAWGIWWMMWFTRPSSIAQFTELRLEREGTPNPRPSCPLPLVLTSAFFFSCGAMAIPLLAIPWRVPTMIFGHSYFGPFPKNYVFVSTFLSVVSAVGILKLKPWGINLAMGLGAFDLANHVTTLASFRSIQVMRDALAAMALQGYPAPLHDPTTRLRYDQGLAIAMVLITLTILLAWRPRFLRTAAAIRINKTVS